MILGSSDVRDLTELARAEICVDHACPEAIRKVVRFRPELHALCFPELEYLTVRSVLCAVDPTRFPPVFLL